jgi:hypothetical protein
MKKALIFFAAGCLGGLANSVAVWGAGYYGITSALDVAISPQFSPQWLYPRIVWGGLWGLLFLLPMLNSRLFYKGTVLSVFPTIAQLFVVFPFVVHKGIAGIELGILTPLLVVIFNWIWGVVTALTIKIAK